MKLLDQKTVPLFCRNYLFDDYTVVQNTRTTKYIFVNEVWSSRNVGKLDKTAPLEASPDFGEGDTVIWRAQINPTTIKTATGKVVAMSPTAALIRFSTRRLAWCSMKQLRKDFSETLPEAIHHA